MYKYLEKIKSPQDLKKMNNEELLCLCSEIRDYLINSVSKSGGHLASNLGVVELTVALHRVLDAPSDKIVFDVGHQSYVHKILTGRFDKLDTIRSLGGLCGFCNPSESEYDTSYTGHASASLSTALGLVQAKKYTHEAYEVACVIGDGAFTGGMSYEAINNIGLLNSKILIVLNDNEMSIAKNVGAFSRLLSMARTSKNYTFYKRKIESALKNDSERGEKIYSLLRRMKFRIKSLISPNVFFEQLGITYLGPVDGHNIEEMEKMFRRALALNEPVLVHVRTKKGKGYAPAETKPQVYHGVNPFEVDEGVKVNKSISYSDVFGRKLTSLAERNEKLVAITPAMIPGSGLTEFYRKYRDRLYDVGIAEEHAVTFGAGLSLAGVVPVCAIYSTFLQRSYDSVIHDVCLGNNHVIFAIDRAGLVPGDGATHQGLFDITYLSAIPNMTILSPSSFSELEKMLEYAVEKHNGPIAIRFPRGQEIVAVDNGEFILSKASLVKEGKDITIVCEGQTVSMALEAGSLLEKKGISAEIIDVRTIKPLDYDTIIKSGNKTGIIYTLEENMLRGGMGEMIASYLSLNESKVKIHIQAIDDEFVPHGKLKELNEKYGYLPYQICEEAERIVRA